MNYIKKLVVYFLTFELILATPISVGISDWIGWSGVTVANELGFLPDDTDIFIFKSCYDNVKAFEEGKVTLVYDMIGTFFSLGIDNVDLSILMVTDYSNGGDVLVTRKISSVNKEIYTYTDLLPTLYFAKKALEKENLKFKDFTFIQFEPEFIEEMFLKGKIDSCILYEPIASKLLGDGRVVASTRDIPKVMPEGIAILNSNLVEYRERIIPILEGLIKGQEWIRDPKNKEEYFKILRRTMFKKYTLTDEEIESMYNNVLILNKKELIDINLNEKELFKYVKEIEYFVRDNYSHRIDFNKMVDLSLLREISNK